MQQKVERVARELGKGAMAYEAGAAELDVLLQQQYAAEKALEAEQLGAAAAQQRLNSIANAAYRNPVPESWALAMSVDPTALVSSLENVVTLRRAGATQRAALDTLLRQRLTASQLAENRDVLRRRAQQAQEQLDEQYAELRAAAATAQAELQAAQQELARMQAAERLRAARAAAARSAAARAAAAAAAQRTFFSSIGTGGPPCSAIADGQYANGFLPPEVLCPLRTVPGHQLTAAAAEAFDRMSELHMAQQGAPLCVSDSYRSYPEQVDVFARKPSLAATPGTSQHGWGLAVDLGCGAERFGTPMFQWLKANAPTFGFIHPQWAEPGGSKPEPWHWEYVG